MKVKYLTTAIFSLFIACATQKQPKINQGLRGTIYFLQGNQMPVIGRPISKGRGVSRDIYVYESTNLSQTEGRIPLFTGVKTKLIAHTKSDSSGHYSLALPAGNYSIFVGEGDKFFAAISDGNEILNPIIILVKNISEKDITITTKAAY